MIFQDLGNMVFCAVSKRDFNAETVRLYKKLFFIKSLKSKK